ncbi:hypothetical protein J4H86_18910 [Spiractinospora alimapuensis]|uniref:hypothetical protein n=1 Tax=Spiractinospora alimapuensis TaxID=2820884 RepID=UPI001F2CFC46|nr:hypothetical protein [Spiractinospora alimapuensis]QVQ50915.1 hypothetical protein J4H86_18910 [Spiractinospora alimapuensis]
MSYYGAAQPEVRPYRFWYWVGAALIALGFLGGATSCGVGFVRMVSLPEFVAEFPSGDQVEFEVTEVADPDRAWVLYVDQEHVSTSEVDCAVTGPGSQPQLEETSFEHYYGSGTTYWERLGVIRTTAPGTYTVTCDSDRELGYGLAYGDSDSAAVKGMGAVALSTGATFLLGAVSGLVTILVTLARRRRHLQRGPVPTFRAGPPPYYG